MGAVLWLRKVAIVNAQTKRFGFERSVRAGVDAKTFVMGLGLCLLVSSAPVSSKYARAYIRSWQSSTKTQVPKIGKEQLWKGAYANYEYGYSLRIPRGLVGLSPPAPQPQHGIEIRLPGNQHAHILTNADFSASDFASLDAVVDSDLQESRKSVKDLQVVNRQRRRLRRLEAIRLVVRYDDMTSGATLMNETITAIRSARRPEEAVLYTISLVTPAKQYKNDRKVLEGILRSWRLRPMPKIGKVLKNHGYA